MIFKFGRKIDLRINWSVKKPHGHKGVARSSVVMGFCRHSSHPHPVQTFLVPKGFFREKDTNSDILPYFETILPSVESL